MNDDTPVRSSRSKGPRTEPIRPASLAGVVDMINEAFFEDRRMSSSLRRELAAFIASRHGQRGAYGRLFAPTEKDLAEGFRLFTGEKVTPGTGAWHILGEEALRALLILSVHTDEVRAAIADAWLPFPEWIDQSLRRPARQGGGIQPGMFCCAKCSCALWKHLAARKETRHEAFLAAGLKAIRACRDGKGRWSRWPFHYTLLTISEIDLPLAREEMRYAVKACEQELSKRRCDTNLYAQRRRRLSEQVLTRASTV